MGKITSIIDHIFCIDCEKRLGQVEGEYSKTLKKFRDDNVYKSDIAGGAAFLFWMSIIWRASISKMYGFSLTADQSELLRKTLDKYLKLKFSEIDLGAFENDKDCSDLAYRLGRCPDYTEPKVIMCHPIDTKPYSIMVDEFAFFFYFSLSDVDKVQQNCFGLSPIMKHVKPNTIDSGEYIFPIRSVDFKASVMNIIHVIKNRRIPHYISIIDAAYKVGGGTGEMPSHIKQEILDEITSGEKFLGRMYTRDDIKKSLLTVLARHYK